ncbi:hypothetical protein INR49_002209 [Caranx melampygus]|nr:hypothetical protein INR49_002209 [Caranx melampygus]
MPYTPSGFFCDRLIRERERRDGEGSLNKPLRFNGQDFNTLRQECVQRKSLFEDESFPATVESLGFKELGHKSNKVKNIVWKRPKVGGGGRGGGGGGGGGEVVSPCWHMERHVDGQEICENPQFIVGGASRTDICQGDLGK